MKQIITTLLLLCLLPTIFAQVISSDTSNSDSNLNLQSGQVSGYKILGGCIDWDSNIEYKKKSLHKIGCDSGNCINGIGKYIDSNNNKYIGQFKNGKKNGFGRITYHTSMYGDYFYEGNWIDDKRDGFGKLGQTKNKEVPIFYFYIGNWKDNYWNGEGVLVNDHDHGDDFYVYKGHFNNGFAIGEGTFMELKTIDDFDDEKLNTSLRAFWKQQSKRSYLKIEDIPEAVIIKKYQGNFLGHHSLLDGYGLSFEYSNGYTEKFTYTGIFSKGEIKVGTQLQERLTNNDWTKTDGEWDTSKNFHGLVFGREAMKNGQKYEGYFKNQKYNGPGKFTFSNILNGRNENETPDVQTGIFKDGEYSKPLTSEESTELSKRLKEFEDKLNNSLPLTSNDNPKKPNKLNPQTSHQKPNKDISKEVSQTTCNTVYRKSGNKPWEKFNYFQEIDFHSIGEKSFKIVSFDYLTDYFNREIQFANLNGMDEASFENSKYEKEGVMDGGLTYKQYVGSLIIKSRNDPRFIETRVKFIYKSGALYGIQMGSKGYPYTWLLKFNALNGSGH